MKRAHTTILFAVSLCALLVSVTMAATPQGKIPERYRGSSVSLDSPLRTSGLNASAAASTTYLGYWDFESGPQGWVSSDATQMPEFTHVDDFSGLFGGTFGRLYSLEGLQSVWCGARPSSTDPNTCYYAILPGYGNSWDQGWCTVNCLNPTGDATLDYVMSYDVEPGYDYVYIEYELCDGNLVNLRTFNNVGSKAHYTEIVPAATHGGQIKFRFSFRSNGAWSDEDGLWNTDGAYILDSLTVSDATGTILPTELFETEAVGDIASASGNWQSCAVEGYGDFAGLFNGTTVIQEDPCTSQISKFWGFFNGSTFDYACGGYPGQAAVPQQNFRSQYIHNFVESPDIALSGTGTEYKLAFDVYRDLPLGNLVFYEWEVRSISAGGCPGGWKSKGQVYFGTENAWVRNEQPIGAYVDPGATAINVRLGAHDMCEFWCGSIVFDGCHSHAPLFDNVSVYRIASEGPVWSVKDYNLFQDNFAEDGTTTGAVRADIALDILPGQNINIRPGDSTAVMVSDPDNGMGADAYTGFGAAVYAYVGIWPQGQPDKSGGALTQDAFRWPVVDSLTHNGATWYCLRMDTSFSDGVSRTGAAPGEFCLDLNDNLFTPGDTICFTFCAENALGQRNYWNVNTGTTDNLGLALDNADEFTCLPAGGWLNGGDMLYVDGYDGFGAQPFFDTAFESMGMDIYVDRYDIRAPSSHVGNRPGARVQDVFQQMLGCYRGIFWNTGDLNIGLIGDGTGSPEKSNDGALLYTFLDNQTNGGGIYFSGDNIADEWTHLGGAAVNLRNFITHNRVSDDHVAAGYGTSPYAVGTLGSCFDHGGAAFVDTVVAFGGCPVINDFDVLEPTGTATLAMTYNGVGSSTSGAVITQRTMNNAGFEVGVILSGFSYHSIRDDRPNGNVLGTMDRFEHLYDIGVWLLSSPPIPSDAPNKTASRFQLAQNYPNPFNPTTTIHYRVKETGNVTLRIYNVAGQLVRTLVNDSKTAGVTHVAEWNGRNDTGVAVSSGVYFYKLTSGNFTQTKKMVLLK